MWWGYCRHSGRRLRGQSQWASSAPRLHPSVLQTGDCSPPPGAESHLCLHRVLTPGVPGEHLEQNEQLQPGLRLRVDLIHVQGASSLSALVPLNLFTELLIEYSR